MKPTSTRAGFTIPELLISIFIISLLTITVTTFTRDVFSLNISFQGSLGAQLDARHVIRVMVTELREASPSSNGAYPIISASSTAIAFYTDTNDDGIKEKIRYFVSGTDLKKGVVVPTGNPLVYNDANEKITTLVSSLISSSTQPVFQYYPASYTGTSSPLASPVNASSVRLVQITVIIDKTPAHSPSPIVVTSQVMLRNLKDNL